MAAVKRIPVHTFHAVIISSSGIAFIVAGHSFCIHAAFNAFNDVIISSLGIAFISKCFLTVYGMPLGSEFSTDRSKAVPLLQLLFFLVCASVVSHVACLCFVIVCCSSLRLFVSGESCAL